MSCAGAAACATRTRANPYSTKQQKQQTNNNDNKNNNNDNNDNDNNNDNNNNKDNNNAGLQYKAVETTIYKIAVCCFVVIWLLIAILIVCYKQSRLTTLHFDNLAVLAGILGLKTVGEFWYGK